MATVEALSRRLLSIHRHMDRQSVPRTWYLLLEEDEEIPEWVLAKMHPHDRVVVRRYHQGLLGARQGNWAYGYVYWGGVRSGSALIIWPDHLGKVRKH